MNTGNQTTQDTGQKGLSLVVHQLKKRGARVQVVPGPVNLLNVLCADSQRGYRVRTKTKGPTSRDWQVAITEGIRFGQKAVENDEFWVLVDLPETQEPRFYIIPGAWFRNDIDQEHEKYLILHGGERPVNKVSTHHAVTLERVREFENRWDLLPG